MKLSDFSKRPTKTKSSPKFILKNDFTEQSYTEQITSLESKLSFLENNILLSERLVLNNIKIKFRIKSSTIVIKSLVFVANFFF